MATRLYLVADASAPITPPFDPAWTTAANAVRRNLSLVQDAATELLGPAAVPLGGYALAVQLVSDPLAAQTISGTVSAVSRGREVVFNDDVNKRAMSIRVYAADGVTLRGELYAFTPTASTTELFVATGFHSGQSHADAAALSPVTCQLGDRIVVTLGYGVLTTGSTPQYEMTLGGVGTDHANVDLDTTGTVPWVEFSQNLMLQSQVTLAPAVMTLSAPPVTAVPGVVTVPLVPAGMSLSAPPVTPVPQLVTVPLIAAPMGLSAPRVKQAEQAHRDAELDMLRLQTSAFIEANPVWIPLVPRHVEKTGTGTRYVDDPARPLQRFRLIDQSAPSGTDPGTVVGADGQQRKVEFQMLGTFDAAIGRFDYWVDGDGIRYEVAEVLPDNGYEQRAQVIRYGR